MKRVLILICVALLCLPSALGASGTTYQEAVRAAQRENKPLYLYFYSDSCGYCKMMDKEVLGDKEIGNLLKRDFVYVRINAEKTEDIAKLYGVRGFPSSWFLESSGARIVEAPGYIQKPLFKKVLQYVSGGYYRTMDVNAYLKKH
jgi:thioredoxin-related protein